MATQTDEQKNSVRDDRNHAGGYVTLQQRVADARLPGVGATMPDPLTGCTDSLLGYIQQGVGRAEADQQQYMEAVQDYKKKQGEVEEARSEVLKNLGPVKGAVGALTQK